MTAAARRRENDERKPTKGTASAALRHPIRVRILEVVNERDMSPKQFVNEGLAPDKSSEALSHVSYHFRELAKYGCLRIVERIQRRGAVEHIYRGTARAYFSDAEWRKLSPEQRERVSMTVLQGMIARAEGALISGTFDSHLDRHLTWVAMDLDERGWGELTETLANAFSAVEQIRHDAAKRLNEESSKGIHATVGMLGFQSPPPPAAT